MPKRTKFADGKICAGCGEVKPYSEFNKKHHNDDKTDVHSKCLACAKAYRKSREHKDRKTSFNRVWHLIQEVVRAYGGKCECCGETEPMFLQIDHINGGGRKHYSEIGSSGQMYRWLKKNGFPKDNLRLLCGNCNHGRYRNGGICPHKTTLRKGYNFMNWNDFDKWAGALCAWREARGEGADGMRAVCHVIKNRADAWHKSWAQVVYQPLQFSSMTYGHDPQLTTVPAEAEPSFIDACEISERIFNGGDFDLTNGATHYFNPHEVLPSWASAMTKVATIGNHVFFKEPSR